ncbi:MAG: hypothetical protein Q4D76_19560, partial [Oscillospiraceae bacterium]|nr:hypothetical protein [Oscillospiraceae bacterium]
VKLSVLESKLSVISSEITKLSGTGIDRILEAIKNQRWYFFKNKTKVLLDKNTGYLWANLNYFNWCVNKENLNQYYDLRGAQNAVLNFEGDGYLEWKIPLFDDFKYMIQDKSFPFQSGNNYYINGCNYFYCDMTMYHDDGIDLQDLTIESGVYYVIPYCKQLVENSEYKENVSPNNPNYTEKERLQFTLDLFVQNDLWPIFDDEEITELYKKIYFEKPKLLAKLQEVQNSIEELQKVTLISSEFDYTILLSKYDINAINNSVIKYADAVCSWINELMDKLCCFEKEKSEAINRCAEIIRNITITAENQNQISYIEKRVAFINETFSLESIIKKTKDSFMALYNESQSIKNYISLNTLSFTELSETEKIKRPSFNFVAESTANMLKKTLEKIELFELDSSFTENCLKIVEGSTKRFVEFIGMENTCIKQIMKKSDDLVIALISRESSQGIIPYEEDEITVAEKILAELDVYIMNVEKYYNESYDKNSNPERINALNGIFLSLLKAIEDIIFDCKNYTDREFIMNNIAELIKICADSLLDNSDISNRIMKIYNFSAALVDENNYMEIVNNATERIEELLK